MSHEKENSIHLIFDNVEDEFKAKLLLRWYKKFSLSELDEMERVYSGNKETSKILRALANPQDPIPSEIRDSVEQIKKRLSAIKSDPMDEDIMEAE